MRKISLCPDAVARIGGGEQAPCLKGSVKFYQLPGGVLVEAELTGLPSQPPSGFLPSISMKKGIVRGRAFPTPAGTMIRRAAPIPSTPGTCRRC